MTLFKTPLSYKRNSTRVVPVGRIKIGGNEPICIQSMLTSDTRDAKAVLNEIISLADAQCEMIRITIPNQAALDSMPRVRDGMRDRGIIIPLVADIHFNPKLAIDSCEFFEKIRINPGNYADRKRFEIREYSDAQYQEELDRLENSLMPLLINLMKYGRALRIGTNHGSLSDRILNRYGDTPEGMVESALEFIRVFRDNGYNDIIISMKSSIPIVMLQAYRLLVLKMEEEAMDYPLHLGVTEAGNGLDARIKSAIGIGSLLNDGIGDTIRVSLTEPAENEIPAAQAILQGLQDFQNNSLSDIPPQWNGLFFEANIRQGGTPLKQQACAVALHDGQVGGESKFGFYGLATYKIDGITNDSFDSVLIQPNEQEFSLDIQNYNGDLKTFQIKDNPIIHFDVAQISQENFESFLNLLKQQPPKLILLSGTHLLVPIRRLSQMLEERQMNWPIAVVAPQFKEGRPSEGQSDNDAAQNQLIGIAAEIGGLIADDLINGLVCPTANIESSIYHFCQTILQSTRVRMYKADFISCPSCGRTFFDLENTTEKIKSQTQHLKGVKIGIMGCIVNGPGEMADADFGYVGSAEGKVNLYKQQECVERNIPENQAVDRLIELIKSHDLWVEP